MFSSPVVCQNDRQMFPGEMFPPRYPLAVTRHKDSEATSSSIYTQNDPWEPAVSFENYIRNNEDIVNQVQ